VKKFILFVGLISAWASAPAGNSAPREARFGGSEPAAMMKSPPPVFDQQAALTISQGAIGNRIGDLAFTAGDGRRVRLSDFRGKPLVISLIYTSCYHICPTTTQHLAKGVRIARAALGPDSFSVLTIGFDSANDTPAAMQRFAREQGVNLPQWDFLSADPTTMESVSRDFGFISYRAPHGFDHLIQATIIDAQGKIYRQVYGMKFEIPLLVEPLKELIFGMPAGPSLLSSVSNRIKLFCTVYDPASGEYRIDYSLFLEIIIGLSSIGVVSFFLIREWRRNRRNLAS
jgi:protein SCO1/2